MSFSSFMNHNNEPMLDGISQAYCLLILQEVALLTDGRFSGGSHGFVVGHICPEAQVNYIL